MSKVLPPRLGEAPSAPGRGRFGAVTPAALLLWWLLPWARSRRGGTIVFSTGTPRGVSRSGRAAAHRAARDMPGLKR
ncbi:hypothetical protein LT493_17890 [Streptomyces tricolor]|nr:hypothetical protein [Streptomyces tricolor]